MRNRTYGPYLTAINRVLVSVMVLGRFVRVWLAGGAGESGEDGDAAVGLRCCSGEGASSPLRIAHEVPAATTAAVTAAASPSGLLLGLRLGLQSPPVALDGGLESLHLQLTPGADRWTGGTQDRHHEASVHSGAASRRQLFGPGLGAEQEEEGTSGGCAVGCTLEAAGSADDSVIDLVTPPGLQPDAAADRPIGSAGISKEQGRRLVIDLTQE
jgi:hypothetical protein